MKPILLVLFLSQLSSTLHGQGLIKLNNLSTNSGVVDYYTNLLGQDVNLQLSGGATASNIEIIHTWLLRDGSAIGINVSPGRFADPQHGVYSVPGVRAGDQAHIQLLAWAGNFASFNEAVTAGAPVGQTDFLNPTGNPGSEPALTNMPSWGLAALETPAVVYARLKITVDTNNRVSITWPVGTLLSAPTLAGPYVPVFGATNPYVAPLPLVSHVFYRLGQ